MIVRAHFLIAARLKASFTVDGMDSHFVEGQELPATVAKRVPAGMVGRVLSAAEAERILDAIEGEAGGTFSKIRYRTQWCQISEWAARCLARPDSVCVRD